MTELAKEVMDDAVEAGLLGELIDDPESLGIPDNQPYYTRIATYEAIAKFAELTIQRHLENSHG